MPKRIVFTDADDEFFIEDGCLIHRNASDDVEDATLVVSDNLEEFLSWLTDEVDTLKAKAADERLAE